MCSIPKGGRVSRQSYPETEMLYGLCCLGEATGKSIPRIDIPSLGLFASLRHFTGSSSYWTIALFISLGEVQSYRTDGIFLVCKLGASIPVRAQAASNRINGNASIMPRRCMFHR